MSKNKTIWKAQPDPEDYLAAHDFLSLLFAEKDVRVLVTRLRRAPLIHREAKDLLRASRTGLLERSNSKVVADLKKIDKGKKISPVLLVRGNADHSLIIADGYHRICASWYWQETASVACCLVESTR